MADRIRACDSWELAQRGSSILGEVAAEQMPRLAAALLDPADRLGYRFTGGLDGRGRPAARLQLQGVLHAACDRCGRPVPVPIDEEAQFFFVAEEAELDRLPIDDAPDEPLIGSTQFDLAALIEDQAILALPISPRHEHCGSPLRQQPAPSAPTLRPFEALAGLKKRGH